VIQPKIAPFTPEVAAHEPVSKARRRRRAWLLRYGSCVKVLLGLGLVLAPVMSYVMLTSNLTGLTYALTSAEAQRTKLQGDVQRLDDRIAHLESRERLYQIAKQLGMRDPNRYEVVTLAPPAPARKTGGLAFLGWLRR
jgi:cell division protein FtsL